ncbi:MAG: tRNA (adenosine(37)-N6)-dimethylallyltransferase MiaA [Angelakisella sp.]
MQNRTPLVAVVGPTASGKTRLAIELAKALSGEIISGDSMQLYQRLSIATAKPTAAEQAEVPHHLIDLLEPWESFSVAQYTTLAHKAIAGVYGRGNLPILAGGTGLYIRSLLDNLTFTEQPRDPEYCAQLRLLAEREGGVAVHRLLLQADPTAAQSIHPNNLGRVIRALEVCHTTGGTMTAQKERSRVIPSPYRSCVLGITYRNRQLLYDRIDLRVSQMVEQGLLEEARMALSMELSPTASQAIGYKELRPYFAGEQTLDEALETIRQQSRRYAKRQMTWFKREQDIHWLYADEVTPQQLFDEALELAKAIL